jgi:hypothetical protein
MLGERRRGSTAVTVTGSDIEGNDRVTFLHRHLPTSDETAAQLWAFGVTGTASSDLAYKDTSWHTVSVTDAFTLTGGSQYQMQAQSLHGKLFIAADTAVDRLHVWDGTSLRRVGLATPSAAPTAADTAVGGTFAGVRYYRIRYTVKSGSTTLRRSEPSDVRTFTPNGSFDGAVVTKPASISEDETHWELEASTDNANFYRIATTVVGTTTYTDQTVYATGYANVSGAVLSADSGDYTVPHSPKFVTADQDRLLIGGSWEQAALASRVSWTPVFADDGDGNDERIPIDTDNFLDLDSYEGGPLTGLSATVNGYVYAFKSSHVYKLVRTGDVNNAYTAIPLTKQRGAIFGSLVEGLDQQGRPCLYFLDPKIGPCRLGDGGLQSCGEDIRSTWETVNINATSVVCRSLYDPVARQIHFWVATGSSNVPDTRLVLQVNLSTQTEDGIRKGWSIWTGPSATALATCLFADNIDAGIARNVTLRPFIGLEGLGLIQRTDTGYDDNGTAYTADIVTKPYTADGTTLNKFGVMAAGLVADANASASIAVKAIRDFGLETLSKTTSLAPSGSEVHVIKTLDSFNFSELSVLQLEFTDTGVVTQRWELDSCSIKTRTEQTA